MTIESRIDRLEDSGKFLFVFSDKYNIYYIYKTGEKLYKITTDKYLEIESADEIILPKRFNEAKKIKFFKPYSNTPTEHSFIGVCIFEDSAEKFNIEREELIFTEELNYINNNSFSALECLENLSITAHIQKKNKLFMVGKDNSTPYLDNFFGVVKLEEDMFQNLYYIYSDEGDVHLTSLNIDMDEYKVYVAGYVNINNGEDTKPYTEVFLLRP